MVYFSTYDLNSEGQKYEDVIATIKDVSNNNYCSYWKSSYLISSDLTQDQIADRVIPYLDKNDSLIIIEVTKNYQGWQKPKQWEEIKKVIGQ